MPSKANPVSPVSNFKPCIGFTGRPAAAGALQEIQGFVEVRESMPFIAGKL